KMEKENLVSSLWQESEMGPKRRIYEITDTGREELKNWIHILNLRKTRIEALINKFNEISK
uniref:PadR family transcriptional regulator n=1 Tax=Macellibacteroides fermentans TaxID=879969 RepID=UPI00406CE703